MDEIDAVSPCPNIALFYGGITSTSSLEEIERFKLRFFYIARV